MVDLAFGLAGKVLEKLGSFAYQELCLAWGLQTDLKKIERTISTIKIVLLDAEDKQASNLVLRDWLWQLKDILYDADDVIDEIEYNALRKQAITAYGSTSTKVRHFFSSSMALPSRLKLAHKIKDIRERLDEIKANKNQFNLIERREDEHVMPMWREMTHSSVESLVIGRHGDKEKIVEPLMKANGNVNVISIVGLGGMGKTTLAKLVYNDETVVNHFQLKMWVCVSTDFRVTRLMEEVLKSAGCKVNKNSSTEDTLQTRLRELLEDKRFLLVLDDVRNDNRNKWVELIDLLNGGSHGSVIVVTTRSHKVSSILDPIYTHSLEGLSKEDCLSLFVKCAFKEGEDKRYPNLLSIADKIVEKCKRVPLAVKSLGGLLYSKVDEREWEFVRDSEIWELEENEGSILPALRLSYNQMPIHLKRCFAYCVNFPKDHEFNNFLLIEQWVAHGLILQLPVYKKQELEDIGDLYIKELMSRCFFQDLDEPIFDMYTFKMHDLVHDLVLSIGHEEWLEIDSDNKDMASTVHHLSISSSDQQVSKFSNKLANVRSIMYRTKPHVSSVEACISRFKSLRVLAIPGSNFENLPSSIGTQKHLRYLDLSNNLSIKKLPNSICKLHNLQTLLLGGCRNLERLPKDMRNMINLRFLGISTKDTCLFVNGVCCFNSLQILFVVECPRLECLFPQMDRCLTNLRILVFVDCDSLTSLPPIIKHLKALESLCICDCEEIDLTGGGGGGDVQDLNLRLQILYIINLPKLEILPEWLLGSANTLKELHINGCENLNALPEWLPTLKSLHSLEIIECDELSSLPEGIHHMKTLRKVKIKDCPQLVTRLEDWSNIPELELDSEDDQEYDEHSEKGEDDQDDQEDDEDSKKGEDDEEDA
ncbi:hypothetical protein F2P56_009124 [Juglans regia]|uniref:Disease resistance protein RGA1 n=2 Tax=Juglans regia TaxID=51240 RepID=A0A6P9ECY3_JUGRE|nr:putative disease resistance protein RGA1 [Juglans regia]KAF5472403.1 hypothetical protein F2P56_009124 [Juglans regia]